MYVILPSQVHHKPLCTVKAYQRQHFTLCHACFSASSHPAAIRYALARRQIRLTGFLPFSFNELDTHDRILAAVLQLLPVGPTYAPPLTPIHIAHLISFTKHHSVVRSLSPPPPASSTVQCAARSIANLPTYTPNPSFGTPQLPHPLECPHCFLRIPNARLRLAHILSDCPARQSFHPTRPPDQL